MTECTNYMPDRLRAQIQHDCCRVYRRVCKEVSSITETSDGRWQTAGDAPDPDPDEPIVVEEVLLAFKACMNVPDLPTPTFSLDLLHRKLDLALADGRPMPFEKRDIIAPQNVCLSKAIPASRRSYLSKIF